MRGQKAPWERLKDMYAPYPSAGEFYTPNMSRQVYSADTVSGNLDELPTENLMKGVRRWDEKADLLIPSPYYSESGCVSVVGT